MKDSNYPTTRKKRLSNPEVWGPHYWFFLHTIAFQYPETPNAVTKRKYYDLIINFPLFIPDEKIGDYFAILLDKYPVTPYLDKRESFMRWVWFIHNKVNKKLDKPEMGLYESIDKYMDLYTPPFVFKFKKEMQIILWILLVMIFILIARYFLYH